MFARSALVLAAVLVVAPAGAQPVPPLPADEPPPPARLGAASPGGPAEPPLPPLVLPNGIVALPEGGWRVAFTADAFAIADPVMQATLAELGRRLGLVRQGRVALNAEASGPATDVSAARRSSLMRALSVKQALVAGGLAENRIDVRPLGRTAAGRDAVEILPAAADAPRPQR
jgi:hypothetical protein